MNLVVKITEVKIPTREYENSFFMATVHVDGSMKRLKTCSTTPRALADLFSALGDESGFQLARNTGQPYHRSWPNRLKTVRMYLWLKWRRLRAIILCEPEAKVGEQG